MLNPAFAANATAEFNQVPAQGPYTLAMSNTAIFIPLPNVTNDFGTIISKIRGMAADGSAAAYLPADYRSDPTMIAGYSHQLSILADLLSNPEAPSLESGFATGYAAAAALLHPMSRGTVRLNPKDFLQQPLLDYRSGSNPVDFDLHLAHLKYLRRLIWRTMSMKKYSTFEMGPGEICSK